MATLSFTRNLARHVDCPELEVPEGTVAEALERAFALSPKLRGYVLDDQGGLRHHMSVFVDGRQIEDRARLSDRVGPSASVYVMQALSGG